MQRGVIMVVLYVLIPLNFNCEQWYHTYVPAGVGEWTYQGETLVSPYYVGMALNKMAAPMDALAIILWW